MLEKISFLFCAFLSRQYLPMILWVVERKARAHTWLYVTALLRDDSRKSAAKTTRSPLLPRAKQSYHRKVLVTKWAQAPTLKREASLSDR